MGRRGGIRVCFGRSCIKRRIRKELPEFQKNQERSGCGETPADTDKCKNHDGKKNETAGKSCVYGQ